MTEPAPRLELQGVSKSYGSHRALRDVQLRIMPGELHGLVGQNGSGKSTLAKILTGYQPPDPGAAVLIDGEPLRLPVRIRQARDLGLAVVHQSLGLFEDATVVENIRIGAFGAHRWTRGIRWTAERDAAGAVLARLGRRIALDAKVADLSAEDRATVAIARALQQADDGRGIVIFDESTRALSRDSLGAFYELVEGVLSTGTAVLLISHRLEEVLEVTDAITILRDGQVVESGTRTTDHDHGTLVEAMLGRPAAAPGRREERAPGDGPLAELSGLTGDVLTGLNLTIGKGEVVGITGLDGSGHQEVPYLVAGVTRARTGTLTIGGARLDLTRHSVAGALAAGVALVPEDRDGAGLVGAMTVAENITLPQVRARSSALRVDRAWERTQVSGMLDRLGVRPHAPGLPVGALSGGNRQKVLLAKWLATGPDLLVLHEPTQAVDVGARADIIAVVGAAAAAGRAVLVSGGDEEELAALCDRVIVLDGGVVSAELTGPLTAEAIAQATHQKARRPLRPSQRWSAGHS